MDAKPFAFSLVPTGLLVGALFLPACSPGTSDPSEFEGAIGGNEPDSGGAGRGAAGRNEGADGASGQGGSDSVRGVVAGGGQSGSRVSVRRTDRLDSGAPPAFDAGSVDGAGIYQIDDASHGQGSVIGDVCPSPIAAGCVAEVQEGTFGLCNGLDDDCDGSVDEGCSCVPGEVQPCFAGPPARRNRGACQDGMQQCQRGPGEFGGIWGECSGGISPSAEACDGIDNDCNGCADEIANCVPAGRCPEPGDPRVPEGKPFTNYPLRGADFYRGDARSWSWTIKGGPCDAMRADGQRSFELLGATSADATFIPKLSGDYTVTLLVITRAGETFTCTWIVHVRGPGLRIEMCYPESLSQDLDLFLKRPAKTSAWYMSHDVYDPSDDQCDWHNCEAQLRTDQTRTGVGVRADWGYENSPLSECSGGPQGSQWVALGYCANPRLDIDNNLSQGSGLPENINVDVPREGERFRVMVQNFTGMLAHPLVNVYCGGRLMATYGAAPDQLVSFEEWNSAGGVGAMWRVADVTTRVAGDGATTCTVEPLHPASGSGYWVTVDDLSF